jgi:hypothetical protein
MPELRPVSVAAVVAVLVIGTAVGGAQSPNASRIGAPSWRTKWGAPDLEGLWRYSTMTPLERPREFAAKEMLSEEEAAAFEQQTLARQRTSSATAGPDWWDPDNRHLTDRRTSLIVDPPTGRIPALTTEAQARAAARVQARREHGPVDDPEDLPLNTRCLQFSTAGPPMLPGVYNNNVQIVQTRGYIALVNEMIHDTRIIPLDGRPHGALPRWMGDPIGHWDGATLVVDSVNFNDKNSFRGADAGLHLIERFTRIGDDAIDYRFTIDDPTVWLQPWTADFPMKRASEPMYEFACHEGNFRSLEGMFKGARFPAVP